jgi:hypothetical protein
MYIHTHDERPSAPPHKPWRPHLLPLVPVAIAVALFVVAAMVPPLPSYLCLLAGCALIVRTIAKLVPSSNGLRDYRQ